MEADIAKTDRARETKIAELAYKSEQAKQLGDYYERTGIKTNLISISKSFS
jgi:hypothetical protein